MIEIDSANLTILKAPLPMTGIRSWRLPVTLLSAIAIALLGVGLRLWLPVGFHGMGFDEALYRAYALALDERGLGEYDTITQAYLVDQRRADAICKLPPTRFLYVFSGWAYKCVVYGSAPPADLKQAGGVERDPMLASLHSVSRLFSVLLLLMSGVAAWRMLGRKTALVVLALMATAPLQLHMAGHALIDGFFSFWAVLVLWSLWENLRVPNHTKWLIVYGISLSLMILTKENSFFVALAIGGILYTNRWTGFGTISKRLRWVTLGSMLLGIALLSRLAGSLPSLFEVYHLLVTKAEHLEYAILTGDGPWHRYLIDEVIVTPFVLCLAIGAMFGLARKERSYLFLTCFVVFSYAAMCQVRHGMNLRYATIWDFSLCSLAAAQLIDLSKVLGRWERLGLPLAVVFICGYELWQYYEFFVVDRLYEIPTESLLRAVNVLKS